ncbi:MAG TPA: hypothetical protein V6D05_06055 [Stenomitos sp.]
MKLRADRIETDRATGISTALGNVRLEVESVVITTDRLQFNQNERVVSTDTPFTLVQQGADGRVQTITGTGLSYSMRDDTATIQGGKLEVPAQTPGQVVYITGKQITSIGKREFEVQEGTFTTCDFVAKQETPHYHAQASYIKYVPDEYATGNNVTMFVNNRPVFWLPWFYIPLRRRESSVQAGRNNVEGLFLKTSMAYRLNDRNSGNLYLSALEFKKPGAIGFDHVWDNSPNSISSFLFYGLPLPDLADYVPGQPNPPTDPSGAYVRTNPWIVNRLDPANPGYFQDHWWKVRHQQRLLGQMTLDGWYEDRNMYDLGRISPSFTLESLLTNPQQPYRDDHVAWYLGMTDNRFGLTYGANRNVREEFGFSHTRSTQDTGNVSGTYGGTNFTARSNRQEQAQLPLALTRNPNDPTPVVQASPSLTTTLTNNLQVNQTFTTDLRGTSTTDHTRTDYPGQPRTERLTQSFDLTQNLGWGNGRGLWTQQFNLAIPATASAEERRAAIAGLGYVEKIPELSINSNPLLEQFQPFTVSGVFGRYVEGSAYSSDLVTRQTSQNPAVRLEPVDRIKLVSQLTSKPLDLGLGTQLNFGSTGYEQRFYSTGDAEYRLTGQAALTNQFSKYVNTNLTYHRDFTPPQAGSTSTTDQPFTLFGGILNGRNASPFKQFESLSLSKQNTLNGTANAVYEEIFTWNNSLGYNYEVQQYTPYSTGITFRPSRRVNLTLNTGYTFNQKVPYLEFGTGQWQDISSTLHVQSNDEGFGGAYGQDNLVPGWSFDTSLVWSINSGEWRALSNKLSLETGTTWQTHWALVAEGQYDVTTKQYELLTIGINKDLHDFILSAQYNKRLEAYTLNLAMVAFPTNLVNLSNKSFGGLGDPASQLGGQLGFQGF